MKQHTNVHNIKGITLIDSGKPGKTMAIVACTHGNEPVGTLVHEYLKKDFDIEKHLTAGKIFLITANLQAQEENKRFIDYDMNRIWDFDEAKKNTYEYTRAKEIAAYLEECDIVFDIHSTQAPSDPFFIPVQHCSDEFLSHIDCSYIIKNIHSFVRGKLLTSHNPHAQSFVLEAGMHTQQATLDKSIKNLMIMLRYFGMIENTDGSLIQYNAPCYREEDVIKAETMDVEYLYTDAIPQSFDLVKAGTPILRDGEKIVAKDKDYYLLMPCPPHCMGDEMCHLVVKES